ncbi:MAG: sulfotransferase family protein [Promethearchaeota archaeon]
MKDRNNNRTCVIILGMHRSGTSCLTGILQQYGLYLGEVSEQNPHNIKGNRENQNIMKLNNRLLSANRGSWKKPPSKLRWNTQHKFDRDRIINSLSAESEKLWGFKDPRTLITFNFWKEGLISIKPVGIYRHPEHVAKSLYKRNNIPIEDGLKLWKQYNIKLLTIWEEYSFPIISFDVSQEEFLNSIKLVTEYLNIINISSFDKVFFNDSLRHHLSFDNELIIQNDILEIYKKLKEIYSYQMQIFN